MKIAVVRGSGPLSPELVGGRTRLPDRFAADKLILRHVNHERLPVVRPVAGGSAVACGFPGRVTRTPVAAGPVHGVDFALCVRRYPHDAARFDAHRASHADGGPTGPTVLRARSTLPITTSSAVQYPRAVRAQLRRRPHTAGA